MRMYDIIKKKRDGAELTTEEINFFIDGCVKGYVKDYQISAMLMAIYFSGMSERETADLTFAIRDSGEKINIDVGGIKADKHSTGGVGDKTSLIVMPIVSSLGIKSVKMSGRGLGHTGGTVDKLESITGFRTDISVARMKEIAEKVGLTIVGQTASLAPADKVLYALRDVTATVDSMPLIASSIMGKKLAVGDDVIVLDVKTGSGAFMKSTEDSVKLAKMCVEIGKKAGKKISALITDMDSPLGNAIGNSLEVIEAIETLKGNGPKDLTKLSIALAAEILRLCDMGSQNECESMAIEAIKSGRALETFARMVEMQGGNKAMIYDTSLFAEAPSEDVISDRSGFIESVNAEGYGTASLLLGAGRSSLEDKIDPYAGIRLHVKRGGYVRRGEKIATLYGSGDFASAREMILRSTVIGDKEPQIRDIVLGRIV